MDHVLSNGRVIPPSMCHSQPVLLDAVVDVWLAEAFQRVDVLVEWAVGIIDAFVITVSAIIACSSEHIVKAL